MELMTISEVTKMFNVTTRMLRYYDEIGLLPSLRTEDYAYRVYDEVAVMRLQQIITLRKLRIPLKKIASIFDSDEQAVIVNIFRESIDELDTEIAAFQTIKDILRMFVARLNSTAHVNVKLDMLNDTEVMDVINTLSLSKINFKEEHSMSDLNKASEALSTLKNVRIIYLPPCTVASSHFLSENPEDIAMKPLVEFARSTKLYEVKPDLRVYGFNNPNPQPGEVYGYEFWVTIPNDMQVPAPLQKKQFAGGLYAAHCIKMGDFHEWDFLVKWLENNLEYEFDGREPYGMHGLIEEHLNAYSFFSGDEKAAQFTQLDLLIPIKPKNT